MIDLPAWLRERRDTDRVPTEVPEAIRAVLEARPEVRLPWRALRWAVLDLETTGLDPDADAILSIGIVDVVGGRVQLESAWQTLVRPPDHVPFRPESTRIHGLLPRDLAQAPAIGDVLPACLQRLAGRIVVAHMGLTLDGPFLARALRERFGRDLHLPLLDTARLADTLHDIPELRFTPAARSAPRRLGDLASAYGIPVEREHDALSDALVCAQLFLVLAARMEALGAATGARLLRAGGGGG